MVEFFGLLQRRKPSIVQISTLANFRPSETFDPIFIKYFLFLLTIASNSFFSTLAHFFDPIEFRPWSIFVFSTLPFFRPYGVPR